jgi:hypothetical protein
MRLWLIIGEFRVVDGESSSVPKATTDVQCFCREYDHVAALHWPKV